MDFERCFLETLNPSTQTAFSPHRRMLLVLCSRGQQVNVSRISSIGTDAGGRMFASASTTLADGSYTVKVIFRTTKVLRLLFN